MAVDAQGNIYVADYGNNRIQKLNQNGKPIMQFGGSGTSIGELHGPVAVAVDSAEDIYVLEDGGREPARIQKLGPDGKRMALWRMPEADSGPNTSAYSLAVDNAGNVFATFLHDPLLLKLDSTLAPVARWDKANSKESYVSHFSGVAVDNQGLVYVTDPNNYAIFRLSQ